MRFGFVREAEGLPPREVQRWHVESASCELVLEEQAPTPQSQRALWKLLSELKPGDELILYSLDVLQLTTGQLLALLRSYFRRRVGLALADGSRLELLTQGDAPPLIELLADHEARWPSRLPSVRRARRNALSEYQLDHARGLLRKGWTLRSVGLLFRVTPNELRECLEWTSVQFDAEASRWEPQA